jgi:hypothetical protein
MHPFLVEILGSAPPIVRMSKTHSEPYDKTLLQRERLSHFRVGFGTLCGIHPLIGFNVIVDTQDPHSGHSKAPDDTSHTESHMEQAPAPTTQTTPAQPVSLLTLQLKARGM